MSKVKFGDIVNDVKEKVCQTIHRKLRAPKSDLDTDQLFEERSLY